MKLHFVYWKIRNPLGGTGVSPFHACSTLLTRASGGLGLASSASPEMVVRISSQHHALWSGISRWYPASSHSGRIYNLETGTGYRSGVLFSPTSQELIAKHLPSLLVTVSAGCSSRNSVCWTASSLSLFPFLLAVSLLLLHSLFVDRL